MVIPYSDFGEIQNLRCLLFVGTEVFLDLFAREWLPQFVAAGGIPDHRSETSDDDDDFVSGIHELLEFPQRYGVAEVEFRTRWVDAPVDTELLS